MPGTVIRFSLSLILSLDPQRNIANDWDSLFDDSDYLNKTPSPTLKHADPQVRTIPTPKSNVTEARGSCMGRETTILFMRLILVDLVFPQIKSW